MGIRILLLILCVSCGAEVKIPSELKDASSLNKEKLYKNGTAIKQGTIYSLNPYGTVSKFSSKGALKFFESIPSNTPINVQFIGGVGSGEVIVEEIKKAP